MSGASLPEVALGPGSLAVADLHLDATDAAAVEPFVAWLDALGSPPALAVLGDLFDVWVGPAQAELAGARAALDALARLWERGTRLLVVPGNRDFLLDASFEAECGARLCPEGFVARVERPGAEPLRVLCVHGDTLCTKDRGYQRLRRVLRSTPVRTLAPRLPRALGLAVARRLRRASARAVRAKAPEEKSIQRDAALDAARAQRADVVLCGHAHAHRDETLGGGTRLVVLDAFGGPRDVLVFGGVAGVALRASSERAP